MSEQKWDEEKRNADAEAVQVRQENVKLKDMSEEKDKKKPKISDLEKLLENEPNDKVYIKPDGTIDVVNLTEQIKSLESRLKEAEVTISEYKNISVGIVIREDGYHVDKDLVKIQSLESRLSQAEAERNKYQGQYFHAIEELEHFYQTEVGEKYHHPRFHEVCHELELTQKENKSIKARLSQLMDVAGKMAGALEAYVIDNIRNDQDILDRLDETKEALASWQDFNNKKGESK